VADIDIMLSIILAGLENEHHILILKSPNRSVIMSMLFTV